MIKLRNILKEEANTNPEFENFADARGEGAGKITDSAKEKGGLSLLTYDHFRVKLPYYKKAAAGKLDMGRAAEEYQSEIDRLYKSTCVKGFHIDQKAFQELMGRIEVLGELLIKDQHD